MKAAWGAAALAVVLAGCGSAAVTVSPEPTPASAVPSYSGPSFTRPATAPAPQVSTLAPVNHRPIQVSDPGQVTQATGQPSGSCQFRDGGQLPDPACTPGAYDPKVTAEILCDPAYSTDVYRPPSSQTTRFKYLVAYPAYGIEGRPKSELDHLINLDLGGSNDGANLWPEIGSIPNPKDKVEGDLHDYVCQGGSVAERASRLHAARLAIAANWQTAEQRLGIG
jgi:hypothetical protein